MNKIIFENNSQPALNDTTLNQLQDNVESAINDNNATLKNLINKSNILFQSDGIYMGATQTATLNDRISNQKNGIVLAWSYYEDGEAKNYWWNFHFIPKKFVEVAPNQGGSYPIFASTFSRCAVKYLKIADKLITGDEDNTANGTKNGISYNNQNFVLRYVFGV